MNVAFADPTTVSMAPFWWRRKGSGMREWGRDWFRRRKGSGAPEPAADWKRQALDDFRQWLDAADEEVPGPGEPEAADPDLRELFAELAALRQEVKVQNREQARAGREMAAAMGRFDTAARDAERGRDEMAAAAGRFEAAAREAERGREEMAVAAGRLDTAARGAERSREAFETAAREAECSREPPAAFEARVARAAEDRCLAATLEVRDALVRGRDAAVRLRDRPRLFGRPPRGAAGVVEGYDLAIRRFDRMLSRFDVRRVETVGRPFDSRSMHAVEARREEGAGDGVVVEELRTGFVRRDDVLRLADVAVNRRRAQE